MANMYAVNQDTDSSSTSTSSSSSGVSESKVKRNTDKPKAPMSSSALTKIMTLQQQKQQLKLNELLSEHETNAATRESQSPHNTSTVTNDGNDRSTIVTNPVTHRRKGPKPKVKLPIEPPIIHFAPKRKEYVHHLYRDMSVIPPAGSAASTNLTKSIAEMTFVEKVYDIVNNEKYKPIVQWMIHGRAFRIIIPSQFEKLICPIYFNHKRYSSFLRQLNNHGFKHLTKGKDRNCYYHECVIRGLPHLCKYTSEPKDARRLVPDPDNEPDFYQLSRRYPLPSDTQFGSSRDLSSFGNIENSKLPSLPLIIESNDERKEVDSPITMSINVNAPNVPSNYRPYHSDSNSNPNRNLLDAATSMSMLSQRYIKQESPPLQHKIAWPEIARRSSTLNEDATLATMGDGTNRMLHGSLQNENGRIDVPHGNITNDDVSNLLHRTRLASAVLGIGDLLPPAKRTATVAPSQQEKIADQLNSLLMLKQQQELKKQEDELQKLAATTAAVANYLKSHPQDSLYDVQQRERTAGNPSNYSNGNSNNERNMLDLLSRSNHLRMTVNVEGEDERNPKNNYSDIVHRPVAAVSSSPSRNTAPSQMDYLLLREKIRLEQVLLSRQQEQLDKRRLVTSQVEKELQILQQKERQEAHMQQQLLESLLLNKSRQDALLASLSPQEQQSHVPLTLDAMNRPLQTGNMETGGNIELATLLSSAIMNVPESQSVASSDASSILSFLRSQRIHQSPRNRSESTRQPYSNDGQSPPSIYELLKSKQGQN